MYRPFHKLRVRFAEMELKQNEIARRAGMAPSTLTARMMGYQPWTSTEIIAVSNVLDIPTGEIGAFFFEDGPKDYGKRVG